MIQWRKLGHLFSPDGSKPWMRTYASNPTVEPLDANVVRVYFSSRDEQNQSSIAFVDVDLRPPVSILREAAAPVLTPGAPGTFDQDGVSIGCIVRVGTARYLYYMGWRLTTDVPWRNTIGLAISHDRGERFARTPINPIIPISGIDPHTVSYPWVLYEDGRFRMWYGSATRWGSRKQDLPCAIKYAESADGLEWNPQGHIAIDALEPDQIVLARPTVVKDADRFRMWFSCRGPSYRIRSAESTDGHSWIRTTDWSGLDPSPTGWDSEMIEYPCVFDHAGRRFLLYNGNGYGQTGFGLAVLDA